MKKFLYVRFSDEREYKIPVEFIAKSRADHYACEVDGYAPGSLQWKEEYKYSLNDNEELVDWAFNSMDWKDVKDHAILVKVEDFVNYHKEWTNSFLMIREDE